MYLLQDIMLDVVAGPVRVHEIGDARVERLRVEGVHSVSTVLGHAALSGPM